MADSLNLAARGSYQLKEQGKRRFYANEVPILCELLNLTFDEIYGSTISGVDIEISLSIPISDFCF